MKKEQIKAAPYTRVITEHHNKSELIVCTGKDGWNMAKSSTWFSRTPKTVLPFGDDPAAYRWPAHGRNIMIFDFGPQDEGYSRLLPLAKQLLIDGAEWVLLMSKSFPMTRLERGAA